MRPDIVERILDCRGAFLRSVGRAPGVITMNASDYNDMKLVTDAHRHGILMPSIQGGRWVALGMQVFIGHDDCPMVAASKLGLPSNVPSMVIPQKLRRDKDV